jgi:hypothetical protein
VVFDNLPTAEQQPMMLQGQDSGGKFLNGWLGCTV